MKKIKSRSTLNHVFNILDGTFFSLGMVFITFTTILPVFIKKLGGSSLVISLIPFILTLGISLPQLFIASYVERFERKKPIVIIFGLGQRLPWLIACISCFVFGKDHPEAMIAITLGMVLIYSVSTGFSVPPWFDMISKITPVNLRGRIMSLRAVLPQLLGIGGALAAASIIDRVAFPNNYGLLFGLTFIMLVISLACFCMIVEPSGKVRAEHKSLSVFFKDIPSVLKEDRDFSHFIISRALSDLATSATAFYSIYALSHFNLSEGYAGIFTTISAAAYVVGILILGFVGDKNGHKVNILIGLSANILAGVIAIFINNINVYLAIFVFTAIAQGAKDISINNITVEFCSPEKIPTYIALSGVMVVPVSLIVLGMGSMADLFGYKSLFILALAASIISALIMLKVKDPRHSNKKRQ